MSDRVRRTYSSPLREEAARRTRVTIRDAAARLFVRNGYVSTTVKQIAEEAGVAIRTVFTAFPGGKAELFRDALDEAVAGVADADAGGESAVAQTDGPATDRRAVGHPRGTDADLIVEQVVGYGAAMLERAGDLLMTSVESAGADLDMRRFAEDDARATAVNARTIAEGLHRSGWLRDGVDVDHAADVLYTLSSPQVHALLRRDCGWEVDRYRTWLAETLRATLLR
ncbi:helix-turn-helix domain-containing protein [Rhodococcus chondri]|uniref:Helix-turn-helix domain-containing protein n=1 Tax=Rhodococcus chondri TaxID=3065941 RepID=A0ABU7JUP7_9NOCA|nr:helix-turn-helix domain-containing protein [Rhodococcus sp. CC-R104]MEE2033487.1 helix-turn-helix domain-containing protein [Rhodococcus sp. CC-R104]